MKNADKELTIKEKKVYKKIAFIGGIGIFSLLSSFAIKGLLKENEKYKEGEEKYGYYSVMYIEALDEINKEDFDEKFLNIYEKENFYIDDKSYPSKSIYIIKDNDGTVHLIKAGENTKDIITGQDFTIDMKSICLFKNSTVYYDLYESGDLGDDLKLDSSKLLSFIQSWDGKKHDRTPELYADKKASEAYQKKYGR